MRYHPFQSLQNSASTSINAVDAVSVTGVDHMSEVGLDKLCEETMLPIQHLNEIVNDLNFKKLLICNGYQNNNCFLDSEFFSSLDVYKNVT